MWCGVPAPESGLMPPRRFPLAALLALVAVPAALRAQLATRSVVTAVAVLRADVGVHLDLRLSGDSTVRATVDSAARARGWADAGETHVVVRANHGWYLDVSAATADWTDAAGRATAKPAADLSVETAGGAPQSVGLTPVTVASGERTGGTPLTLRYRTAVDPARDGAGTYALAVRYTLVAR